MEDYSKRFSNLNQFLGCYFNQDWKGFYDWQQKAPNFSDVVRHYKTEDNLEGLKQTILELEDFLELKLPTNELKEVINNQFDCSFTGKSLGFSTEQFLKKILEILKEPIELAKPLIRK